MTITHSDTAGDPYEYAKGYEQRRLVALQLDEQADRDARSGCQPWCAGPTAAELVKGSHECPPELRDADVDELQIAELGEQNRRLIKLLRLIVGDHCDSHAQPLDTCPWCEAVELTHDRTD